MTTSVGGPSGEDGVRWFEYADLAVVAAPFFFYWFFIAGELSPVAYPDSFAYLWDGPANIHYFTGRSLATRVLYTLCALDPERIAAAQLLLTGATAVALQALFRERGRPFRNGFVALALALVFSGYAFSLTSVMLSAEPLFLDLLLLFPSALFFARGRHAALFVLAVGTAFVLSKNVAPYACLMFVALRVVTLRAPPGRALVGTWCLLATLAVGSATVSSRFDSSVHINTFHNITRRVLDTPGRSALFHSRYAMPLSPLVRAYTGKSAGNARLMEIDPVTRNFALRDESSGLAEWVRARGFTAYLDFLLRVQPAQTLRGLRSAWKERAPDAAAAMTAYLGHRWRAEPRNNLETLRALGPHRDAGFFGVDPLALALSVFWRLGFADLYLVFAFGCAGLAAARFARRPQYFALGGAGLVGSTGLYFISFYGDAMEVARHTAPAVLLATLAFGVLLAAGVRFSSEVVGRAFERAHLSARWQRLPIAHPIVRFRARRSRQPL